MIKKINRHKYFFLFSTIYIFLGIYNFKDYGVGIEEHFQRSSGFYWLNYILKYTNLYDLQNIVLEKLIEIKEFSPDLPSLEIANYYGILFDLPTALIESIFKINVSQDYFYFRHLLNFIIFYISGVFFYKIILLRTNNNIVSFFGSVFYLIIPKAFGNSFFDNKDLFFLSIMTINFYYFYNFEIKRNFKNLIIFSLFSAFTTSSRIFGLMIPVSFILIFIFQLLSKQKKIFIFLFSYILFYLFFLFLIWPYTWNIDMANISNFFAPFKVHGQLNVFFLGNYYLSDHLPFSYLPLWIIISTPLFLLILFIFGFLLYLRRLLLRFFNLKEFSVNNDLFKGKKEKFDFLIFLCISQVIFVYLSFNINLIKGWTHFLFLNFFLVYFATLCIYLFYIFFKKQKKFFFLINTLLVIFAIEVIYKLIIYHPYQYIYFNNLVSSENKKLFQADYQSLSRSDALKLILNDNEKNKDKIFVASSSWTPLKNAISMLKNTEKERFIFLGTDNKEEADYIYTNYFYETDPRFVKKYEIPNNFYLLETVYRDDIKIYSIYKRNY